MRKLREEDFQRQCSWCQRYWNGTEWVEAPPSIKVVTHGICPDCDLKLMPQDTPVSADETIRTRLSSRDRS